MLEVVPTPTLTTTVVSPILPTNLVSTNDLSSLTNDNIAELQEDVATVSKITDDFSSLTNDNNAEFQEDVATVSKIVI
jgi:hypothetical protein